MIHKNWYNNKFSSFTRSLLKSSIYRGRGKSNALNSYIWFIRNIHLSWKIIYHPIQLLKKNNNNMLQKIFKKINKKFIWQTICNLYILNFLKDCSRSNLYIYILIHKNWSNNKFSSFIRSLLKSSSIYRGRWKSKAPNSYKWFIPNIHVSSKTIYHPIQL